MGSLAHLLSDMTSEELMMVASGFSIERETFSHAWHVRFHDDIDFVRSIFDLFDADSDGLVNAIEIEGIIGLALEHGGGWMGGWVDGWIDRLIDR